MAKILEMPKLSPTMEEGVLSAWHKNEGDAVEVDDLLAEVETDKATMEFRAFDRGTILKLLVAAGANVKLGQPVAVIGEKGEDVSAILSGLVNHEVRAPEGHAGLPLATAPTQKQVTQKQEIVKTSEKQAQNTPPEIHDTQDVTPMTTAPRAERAPRAPTPRASSPLDRTERDDDFADDEAATDPSRVLASPYVRRTARERGIDLTAAHGSGPQGRIALKDLDALERVERAPRGPITLPAPGMPTFALVPPESRPLSMMRKTIAKRLVEAKREIPHFYLSIDVDAENLTKLRENVNRELETADAPHRTALVHQLVHEETHEKSFRVSVNDLLIKACAVALTLVPECNAQFSPEAILIHKRVDISVAVAVQDGLVTPVIRDADKKGVLTIAREVRDLAARARAKKLKPEEMRDGTFSISNLGMFGIDNFSAVINPPEGAILAIGQVREEPIVKEGRLVVGKKLAMTLSCDHRVIDGAVGASFLAELRALIEHPMRVLTA